MKVTLKLALRQLGSEPSGTDGCLRFEYDWPNGLRGERLRGYFPESWPRLVEFELSAGEDKRVVIGE